jgi:antirestriction protein
MSEACQIYVACLSAYNNGYLHGEWIDATQDEEDILAEIHTMLAASPVVELYGEVAEEWAIHCYEGFHGIEIDEYESIAKVAQLAQELEEHGEPYAAYLGYFPDGTVEDFEDKYRGCFKDREDFAYDLYEQMGTIKELAKVGLQELYIDFAAIARDLFISDYTAVEQGYNECYVFCDY